jgi:sec-independent protein translocase protein TatC
MPAPHPDEYRMSFADHLEELRYRLILGLVGPAIVALLLLFFGDFMISIMVRPLLVAQHVEDVATRIVNIRVGSAFNVYMKLCFIGGMTFGIPWFLWQMWKFVEPGLHFHERKYVQRLAPFSVILMMLGVAFMYYVVLPVTLWFFIHFSIGFTLPDMQPNALERLLMRSGTPSVDVATPAAGAPVVTWPVFEKDPEKPVDGQVWIKIPEHTVRVFAGGKVRQIYLELPRMMEQVFALDEYIDFVLWMALAFAVAFQLPLVMLIAAWVGLIGYNSLKGVRKFAILGAAILAAVLVQDPVSMCILMVPLYGLYEVGLLAILFTVGKRPGLLEDEPSTDDADAPKAD